MTNTNQLFTVQFKNELKAKYLAAAVKAEAIANANVEKAEIVFSAYKASLGDINMLSPVSQEAVTLTYLGGKVRDCIHTHDETVAELARLEESWKSYFSRLCQVAYEYVFEHVYYNWNTLPESVQDAIWFLTDKKNIQYMHKLGIDDEGYVNQILEETHSKGLEFCSVILDQHLAEFKKQQEIEAKAEEKFRQQILDNISNIQSGISKAEELLKAAGLK